MVGATHSTWNFGSNWPRWSDNAYFQSIFACSTSAVTPSKKVQRLRPVCMLIIIINNGKSITRFPMSWRLTSYVAPTPQGAQKRKTAVFHVKSHVTLLEESLIQSFFVCENRQRFVRHWLAYYPCKNDWWRRPLLRENLADTDTPLAKCRDFQSIFARSASVVTPAKSCINTNGKSTTRFPMSLRWTSYVALKPPRGLKTAKRPFSVWNCTSLEESLLRIAITTPKSKCVVTYANALTSVRNLAAVASPGFRG